MDIYEYILYILYTECPILEVAPKYFFGKFKKKNFSQKLFGSKGNIKGYH